MTYSQRLKTVFYLSIMEILNLKHAAESLETLPNRLQPKVEKGGIPISTQYSLIGLIELWRG